MNVLVVEDEINLADAIAEILKTENYDVDLAHTGSDGLALASKNNYSAIVLDVMLPGIDGYELVSTLRAHNNLTPVIMLTARTQLQDKVQGLQAGADDYLTKPFDTPELLARLEALIRRSDTTNTGTQVPSVSTQNFGDLIIDADAHDLVCKERRVHLSQTEFDVLCVLLKNQNKVVSKDDLMELWDNAADTANNSVEAYISFLRKKLIHIQSKVRITTLRMIGYRLEYDAD